MPRGGAPDAVRAEGVAAYRTYLRGLLDITDSLDAEGRVIPPEGVIRHDQDDPYLVVAADKGTASFSDIANGMAESYNFWLGDAFASGGSAGYDHKAMGITARGAWEAVKRHFRELGKDIQKTPFTCVGVGDMSGDVFGNGMLLSAQTRLVAAFDHRDIFLDPDPDPAKSWAERKRLFDLPRSSWQDYDKSLISKGGGVYPRTAKSIPLTPEVKAMLDLTEDDLTPADLIRAILKAPAELLYLGGIGTYVKAPGQSQAEVGDKANDAVRVDATDLRVKVVGEGANLGVTQAGRIAFARAGGRIDTDAIDNSAGVDTSDHEVNIKILTSALEAKGELKRPERNKLLQSMTDEVAAHVLAHNHDQTLALSLLERTAPAELDNHARFMAELVAAGRLDRVVEGLPSPAQMIELAKAGKGLVRPELAVLLAYGKLELSAEIVGQRPRRTTRSSRHAGSLFPQGAGAVPRGHARPPAAARDHRHGGGQRHRRRRRADLRLAPQGRHGLRHARSGGRLRGRLAGVPPGRRLGPGDGPGRLRCPAAAQLALYQEVALVVRRQTYWLARRVAGGEASVHTLVEAYRPAADEMRAQGLDLLSPLERQAAEARVQGFADLGAPQALADSIGLLRALTSTSDVADLALSAGWSFLAAGRIYHQVGEAFAFDRLRAAAGGLGAADAYERQAVRQLIVDFLAEQTAITRSVMATAERDTGLRARKRRARGGWPGSRRGRPWSTRRRP